MTIAVEVFDAFVFAAIVVRVVWPWDLRGRRRAVTIKRERRPWE